MNEVRFDPGDLVVRKSGGTGFMRVVSQDSPTTVICCDTFGGCKKATWQEQICELRNVTKSDPL